MLQLFTKLAGPAVVTNFLIYFTVLINLTFAGQLEDSALLLGSIGLAQVLFCILNTLMIGLNTAQETLTSQAYGSKNYVLCGTYLNRGATMLVAFFVPCSFIFLAFDEQIYLAMGQEPEVAKLAAE